MQGWRGSFAPGERWAAFGAALFSLIAVAHAAGAGGGGSIAEGTSLSRAVSATISGPYAFVQNEWGQIRVYN